MSKKFWIFITFVFCDSVNHDTVVMHPSSIQVSKKCVFLEQICRFSVPNFQEVLSHHIYFLLISLFFVFFFICLLFRFFLFLFSPLLSVHLFPRSSPFLLIPVSSVFSFPFYSSSLLLSPLSFPKVTISFFFFSFFVLLCLHLILLFPFLFSYVHLSLFLLPFLFIVQRLTVASHIPRILCTFCPLTAVCGREDPRDISSLVLFPSSLFSFSTSFSSLSVACGFLLLSFFFFRVFCLFLNSIFLHSIFFSSFPFFSVVFSFSHLCFPSFSLQFPTFLLFLSLSSFPKVTISFLLHFVFLFSISFSFVQIFVLSFYFFSYFSVWLATFLGFFKTERILGMRLL